MYMGYAYVDGICKEIESSSLESKNKLVYEGIGKITGNYSIKSTLVKDKHGAVLKETSEIKHRWMEYFEQLYNDPNPVDRSVLLEMPASGDNLPAPVITREEVENAIMRQKVNKAPGIDNITAEEWKMATEKLGVDVLWNLFQEIWEKKEIPTDWKKAIIIPIHKKGDKMDCNNFRGISLLCHCGKIFSSILLHRLRKRTDEILGEKQAGFRMGRGTIDQIFTLRQLAEKYLEFSKDLYICYIDFKKAFDSVWRAELWTVMRNMGYPEDIVKILENMYKETFSAVRVGGELTDWFETLVGVLQGCVLSPLLFNIFLEVIMARALDNLDVGAVLSGYIPVLLTCTRTRTRTKKNYFRARELERKRLRTKITKIE